MNNSLPLYLADNDFNHHKNDIALKEEVEINQRIELVKARPLGMFMSKQETAHPAHPDTEVCYEYTLL